MDGAARRSVAGTVPIETRQQTNQQATCFIRPRHTFRPGHGNCFEGECGCDEGWFGYKCMQNLLDTSHDDGCPNRCSHKGLCGKGGACICKPGWGGQDCSRRGKGAP